MDPEQLRWTLLIIGSILIVAVYMFGRHQSKLRNRAAIKTYTQEELEDPYIDDDTLRRELEVLDTVLSDDKDSSYQEININPAMEVEYSTNLEEQDFIKQNCDTENHLVSYLLKRSDGRTLNKNFVHDTLMKNGFLVNTDGNYLFFDSKQELFSVTFRSSEEQQDRLAAICFIMDRVIHRKNANESYETMLKVIDRLTRELKVKVYNQNQSLLNIEDVTLIRKKLLNIND